MSVRLEVDLEDTLGMMKFREGDADFGITGKGEDYERYYARLARAWKARALTYSENLR